MQNTNIKPESPKGQVGFIFLYYFDIILIHIVLTMLFFMHLNNFFSYFLKAFEKLLLNLSILEDKYGHI